MSFAHHSDEKSNINISYQMISDTVKTLHADPEKTAQFCYEKLKEDKPNGIANALCELTKTEEENLLTVWKKTHPLLFLYYAHYIEFIKHDTVFRNQWNTRAIRSSSDHYAHFPKNLRNALIFKATVFYDTWFDKTTKEEVSKIKLHINLRGMPCKTRGHWIFEDLEAANLSDAVLTYVEIKGNFVGMNLDDAYLVGVNLIDAKLDEASKAAIKKYIKENDILDRPIRALLEIVKTSNEFNDYLIFLYLFQALSKVEIWQLSKPYHYFLQMEKTSVLFRQGLCELITEPYVSPTPPAPPAPDWSAIVALQEKVKRVSEKQLKPESFSWFSCLGSRKKINSDISDHKAIDKISKEKDVSGNKMVK